MTNLYNSLKIENWILKISHRYLTIFKQTPKITPTREISPPPIREKIKPSTDSFVCPYCSSKNFVRRGFRQKKMEKVQLYICQDCHKTFTAQITKGKHYPLPTIFDAISIYNLGYSLDQTCQIINQRNQKIHLLADSLIKQHSDSVVSNLSTSNLTENDKIVNKQDKIGVDLGGVEPPLSNLTGRTPHRSKPMQNLLYTTGLTPSTLSTWLTETSDLCHFSRLRPYAIKKYPPTDMVVMSTLVHRQLYRYRFHRAKCDLTIQDDFKNRRRQKVYTMEGTYQINNDTKKILNIRAI